MINFVGSKVYLYHSKLLIHETLFDRLRKKPCLDDTFLNLYAQALQVKTFIHDDRETDDYTRRLRSSDDRLAFANASVGNDNYVQIRIASQILRTGK